MSELKVILLKFVKGFIAGFLAAGLAVVVPNISSLEDLKDWLFALALAGAVGGIVGGLQMAYKAITWKTDEELLAEIQARIKK